MNEVDLNAEIDAAVARLKTLLMEAQTTVGAISAMAYLAKKKEGSGCSQETSSPPSF